MNNASRLVTLAGFMVSGAAYASILPPNNLHLQDNLSLDANINEVEFNSIINKIVEQYKPLAKLHGATLTSNNKWTDATVNASASQAGTSWIINMYGGLARRDEVTPDGFALVVCHELGHHFGGFMFYGNTDWAAAEGQADYFATQACARKIWASEKEKNAQSASQVQEFEKNKCDTAWAATEDRNLCYRTAVAGKSLATLLSALRNGPAPRFDTPDTNEVKQSSAAHPAAQCRLDTYFNGALCSIAFDENVIPGKSFQGEQNGTRAEEFASNTSCMTAAGYIFGVRPRCWFKPALEFLGIKYSSSVIDDSAGNGNTVIEPGEAITLKYNLSNGTQRASNNVTGILSTTTSGITITQANAEFGDIAAGETKTNSNPFAFAVDSNAQCGKQFDLVLKATSDVGSAEIKQSFQLGKNVDKNVGIRCIKARCWAVA